MRSIYTEKSTYRLDLVLVSLSRLTTLLSYDSQYIILLHLVELSHFLIIRVMRARNTSFLLTLSLNRVHYVTSKFNKNITRFIYDENTDNPEIFFRYQNSSSFDTLTRVKNFIASFLSRISFRERCSGVRRINESI